MGERTPEGARGQGQDKIDVQTGASADASERLSQSYLDLCVSKTVGRIWDNEAVDKQVAQGLKTAALFLHGRIGLAGTVALYALDQARPADTIFNQLADAGLGSIKGSLLKGSFNLLGRHDVPIAARGVALGVSSRILESGLSRQTYLDADTGQMSLSSGLKSTLFTSLDRSALIADATIFMASHGMMTGINRLAQGSLRSSPFWSTVATASTFGIATGATGDILRQVKSGQEIDVASAARAGLTRGAIDALAGMPGGMQAQARLTSHFKDTFGLTTTGRRGYYQHILEADGKPITLLSTPPTLKGLAEAQQKLSELSVAQRSDLAGRYGVSFGPGGLQVPVSWRTTEPTSQYPRHAQTREPRFDELAAIRAALSKSEPSNRLETGQGGVKFYFLKDGSLKNDSVAAFFEKDAAGTPSVFMNTSARDNRPATERDVDRDAGYYEHKRDSLESTVTHELGHHNQLKLGWKSEAVEAGMASELGWVPFTNQKEAVSGYLLKGNNGRLYRFSASHGHWAETDNHGHPVDRQGRPYEGTARDEGTAAYNAFASGMPSHEMRQLALIRPVSRYFPKPIEHFNEGLTHFRLSEKSRANLLAGSRPLYELVKREDQKEIDLQFGTTGDGKPVKLRLPDGKLADASAENHQRVLDFELSHTPPADGRR